MVQLIAATTTDTGLKVHAELDENKYPKGVKVSDAQMAAINLSAIHSMATGTTRSRRATKSATENELTDLFMDGPKLPIDVANVLMSGIYLL
jgi:Rhodopirellula transposase DDE domain